MTGPNADAAVAIGAKVVRPMFIGFLDIIGDPIRVTTAPYGISPTGTGDADLDGQVFPAIDHRLISVSDVQLKEGGAETVTVTLSGMLGVDGTLMNQIGNKANWQGRVARLWQVQFDENLQQFGNIWPFYTGYMSVPKIAGSKTSQTIMLDIESYLSFLSSASNRSYLNQSDYDAGDQSASRSIACANGQSAAGNVPTGGYTTAVGTNLRMVSV